MVVGYRPRNKPKGQNPFFRNMAVVDTVYAESNGKRLVEFNSQVYDTYMSPMAKAIEGTELDYHNIAETKPKSFEEMPKEEKIQFVNKEIDNLFAFIEANKQAKYNKWKEEFHDGKF